MHRGRISLKYSGSKTRPFFLQCLQAALSLAECCLHRGPLLLPQDVLQLRLPLCVHVQGALAPEARRGPSDGGGAEPQLPSQVSTQEHGTQSCPRHAASLCGPTPLLELAQTKGTAAATPQARYPSHTGSCCPSRGAHPCFCHTLHLPGAGAPYMFPYLLFSR